MNSAHFHFLIPVFLLLLTIFGVGFATNYYLTRAPISTPTPVSQDEVPVLTPATPRATLPPISKTKTFISEVPAFKFEYPRNWEVLECDSAVSLYSSEPGSCDDLSGADILLQFSDTSPITYESETESSDEIEMSIDDTEAVLVKYEEGDIYEETLEFSEADYYFLFVMRGRQNQSDFGNIISSFQFLSRPEG